MPTLFEKVKIGNLELKNRVVMNPMGFSHTDPDGGFSDRQIEYYVERARGGFGLIYPTATMVTTEFEPAPMPNVLENYSQATRLSILCEKVHNYGAKVCAQLSLGLGRVSFIDPFTAPKSASAVPSFFFPELICTPYTKDEIKFLVKKFGYASLLAKNAGVDAIEIHAYGGYLIDQFLTPLWNKRTDEYGGSLENRLRILYELCDAVWENCGKDFPLIVKLTPDHQIEGGRTLEEGIELLKTLDDTGFTAFHLDLGTYECWYNAVTTVYQKEGVQLYLAEAAKKAGIKTPLLVQGKLGNPVLAEKVVSEGIAELIGLGHPALTDPYWPVKAKEGRYEDIVPCIGCNECIYTNLTNQRFACAVNPRMGMERDYNLSPAPDKLFVLVIGGGPGGITAAITAAQRGFEVELWEKSDRLGGALRAAGAPKFKEAVAKYVEYLKIQLHKSNVKIRVNKEGTAEEILKKNPYAVIIAGGAKPIIPSIPGMEKIRVMDANEMLINGDCPGNKVVVLGGGLVGCEAALHLDNLGKEVTIVEKLDELLLTANYATNNDLALKKLLSESNIRVITGAFPSYIDAGKIIVSRNGESIDIPCDTLIIAVGYQADKSLEQALEGKIDRVFTIGDNVKPAKVIDAVHQGFHTARLLEELC
ncbi:MAG TPA: FAD-dependent oxidoreductase [Clostridiales bacterium]|nr:FAD-dependent oxidoreductase [Clostridiales bacterium]